MDKTPSITIRLTPEQNEKLRDRAKREHSSISAVVKRAVFGVKNAEKSAA